MSTNDDLREQQGADPSLPASGDAYRRARDQARLAVADGLLDLADQRLAEEGPGALSMRRLANAAGCSTMVFYTAFGTKAGLLAALADREAERWIDAAASRKAVQAIWRAELLLAPLLMGMRPRTSTS